VFKDTECHGKDKNGNVVAKNPRKATPLSGVFMIGLEITVRFKGLKR